MTPEGEPGATNAATETPAATRDHRRLLAAVAAPTFVEGFDTAILGLVAP